MLNAKKELMEEEDIVSLNLNMADIRNIYRSSIVVLSVQYLLLCWQLGHNFFYCLSQLRVSKPILPPCDQTMLYAVSVFAPESMDTRLSFFFLQFVKVQFPEL